MRKLTKKRILLVGGGTGGHIYPLISVANAIKDQYPSEILFVGSGTKVEKDILEFENYKWKKVLSGKLRRDISLSSFVQNFLGIFLTLYGFFQALSVLRSFKPDIIFSKGSYVSVPVNFASRVLKIPFVIHESDVMPSMTTKICSKSTRAIFTAFPIGVFPLWVRKKAIYTGLPLREDFKKIRKLGEEYILIVGGSSGALRLNDKIFEILPELTAKHNVIHLVGPNEDRAKEQKEKLNKKYRENYTYYPYRADMANLLKDAKLVISRSGATSIFEAAMLNKKLILVPISPEVAPHQIYNAEVLERLSLAKSLSEHDDAEKYMRTINDLLQSKQPNRLASLYFPNSAQFIASLIFDFIDFEKISRLKKVFMIGIGGVSMKAIAHLLKKMGIAVNGSDLKTGGHNSKNINLSYDMVVYSSAANSHSSARVEHKMAKKLKKPIIKRSEMVGLLMKGYRGISVSGMHGKTSTSMILSQVLEYAGLSPSYLIGAEYKENAPSYKLGTGIDFISEACEYDGSFLDFTSKIAIITNIDKEHLDYFKGGMADIMKQFKQFIYNIQPGGLLVYCQDDPNVSSLVNKNRKELILRKIRIISYGFSVGSMARIQSYKVENGFATFKIDGSEMKTRKIGRFFALNCASAFSVAKFLGVDDSSIKAALLDFSGASRRFELLDEKKGILVYDDYGHHPTEIIATIGALKEAFPKKRKFLIFQPHQQKRFNDFYKDFITAFSGAGLDAIGILPVYKVPGRDEDALKKSSDLVSDLNNANKFFYLDDYESALNFLKQNLREGDIVMTMGATDVYKIAESFLKD